MPFFKKKPIIIEAMQWTGETGSHIGIDIFMKIFPRQSEIRGTESGNRRLLIPTLEGIMEASAGDWIIKGVNNEFYPCKDDIFRKSYEVVDEKISSTSTFQQCPKCLGQGKTIKPPWVSGDVTTWSSSSAAHHVCNVCNGAMIISVPPLLLSTNDDAKMLDWLQKLMTDDSNYCEVFFAGLRNFSGKAISYQIESNPQVFKTVNAKTIREVIALAMNETK